MISGVRVVQSKIRLFISIIGLIFLSTQAPMSALGQTLTSSMNQLQSVGQQILGVTPNNLVLSGPDQMMQAKLKACVVNSGVNSVLGEAGNVATGGAAAAVPGLETACPFDRSDFRPTCAMNCNKPGGLNSSPSCTDWFSEQSNQHTDGSDKITSTVYTPKSGSTANAKASEAKATKVANGYAEYLMVKSQCSSSDYDNFMKQYNAYTCQMGALQEGVTRASAQLQITLQANNKQFQKMEQFQTQVNAQVKEVEGILGPDPELGGSGSSEFKGLLGIQAELNGKLATMTQQQGAFKTAADKVISDTATNEQTLQSETIQIVSSCMKGERDLGMPGGMSLTCFKPRMTAGGKDASGNATAGTQATDQNGNVIYDKQPCGPVEYIRSKVEQSAYVTSRGVIMSQDRRDQAQDYTAEFDSLMNSIDRELGDFDKSGTTSDGMTTRLASRAITWNQIQSDLASTINDLSAKTGLNIGSQLSAVAGHCFSESKTWNQQQQASASSDYSKQKAKIAADNNALTGQLNAGLADMNKSYSDVMSVLGSSHVTIDRSQCTQNNATKMQACYSQILGNLQNLLEGNGSNTLTAKYITAGTMIPGINVPCQGINGCVTNLKTVRDAQKKLLTAAKTKTQDVVSQGNTQVQQQLQQFSQSLATTQASIMKQYDAMKGTLAKMGIGAPDRPKNMDPEQLIPGEGPPPDKVPGPFANPKSMAGVLSGMVQPGGLVNFQDSGMSDVVQRAGDKMREDQKAKRDLADKAAETASKYSSLTCNTSGTGSSSSSAGAITRDWSSCDDLANSCATSNNSTNPIVFDQAFTNAIAAVEGSNGTSSAANTTFLAKLHVTGDSDCDAAVRECRSSVWAQGGKGSKTHDQKKGKESDDSDEAIN